MINALPTTEMVPAIEKREVRLCTHPVFVIGSPRSGTSILPWALAQHSNFWTSRESDLLYNLFGKHYPGERRSHLDEVYALTRDRPEGTWLKDQGVGYEELLACLGLGLNVLFTSRSEPKRWVDQSPVNTVMLDNLAAMFPGALFLHILRDGRRVVHSMLHFENRLSAELKESMVRHGTFPSWARGAKEAARTWKWFVGLAVDFQARNPQRCLTVVNEELSAAPEAGFRRILSFLEAPYEDRPAAYFRNNRINSSFEAKAPPPPDPWNDWPAEHRQEFMAEAGELVCKLEFTTEQELGCWCEMAKDSRR